MALIPVPHGEIAVIVTTLELRDRPPRRPPVPSRFALVRWPAPAPDRYRALFRRVGARWLWFSRLAMSDANLIAATHRDWTQVHAVVTEDGDEVGLLELTHPEPDWCALDFFALSPELAGRGHGRWLMDRALALAWRPGVTFVRVNTCTLDHPAALPSYLRAGFRVTGREIETFPDPRLTGLLPLDSAPQVPVCGTVTTPDDSRR